MRVLGSWAPWHRLYLLSGDAPSQQLAGEQRRWLRFVRLCKVAQQAGLEKAPRPRTTSSGKPVRGGGRGGEAPGRAALAAAAAAASSRPRRSASRCSSRRVAGHHGRRMWPSGPMCLHRERACEAFLNGIREGALCGRAA